MLTAPPLPPPPPPLPIFDFQTDNMESSQTTLQQKLNQELNVGEGITKSLRKVTDDQKTHKNTALRATSLVPAGKTTTENSQRLNKANVQKPPRLELVDKKWLIVSLYIITIRFLKCFLLQEGNNFIKN